MAVPLYQRVMPSGAIRDQVAGVEPGPGNVFTLPAAAVSGYVPKAGDRIIDADKVTRTVTAAVLDAELGIWSVTAPPPA